FRSEATGRESVLRRGRGRFYQLSLISLGTFVLYAARPRGRAPIYLHDAEALFALHAHAIATTGHDMCGRFLPLYFQMRPIGANVWFHPVIVYISALIFKLLPFRSSRFGCRPRWSASSMLSSSI